MGQRRVDKEWPRPRTTRHVWIESQGPGQPPVQAFVLAWRRQSYRWSALVLCVEVDKEAGERFVQQWVLAERLRPVKADPNERPWHY